MLEGIARLAIRAPRRIVAVALLVMAGAAVFGIPAANSLSAGGFQDPTANFRTGRPAVGRHVRSGRHADADHRQLHGGAQGGAARAVGTDIVARLQNSPYVAQVISPWTAPPP